LEAVEPFGLETFLVLHIEACHNRSIEGIVAVVGSTDNHQFVLENPDIISKAVLDKGLDKGTAYEILSIDVADIDIGRNVGARIQA
jgi:uncharacterized protein YqfA (UPF0365 family)